MRLALEVAESRVSIPRPQAGPTCRGVASASLSKTTARGGRARGQGATTERTRGRQGAPQSHQGAEGARKAEPRN